MLYLRAAVLLVVVYFVVVGSAFGLVEEDNAATYYKAAFEALPKDQKILDNITVIYNEEDLYPSDTEFYILIDPLFDLIKQGAEKQDCDWGREFNNEGYVWYQEKFGAFDKICQLACIRSRYYFSHGQVENAIDELLAAYSMARHMAYGGDMIIYLVSRRQQVSLGRCYVNEMSKFNKKNLVKLLHKLKMLPKEYSAVQAFGMDKRVNVDWLRDRVLNNNMDEVEKYIEYAVTDKNGVVDQTIIDAIKAETGMEKRGLLEGINEAGCLYDEFANIMVLPREEYKQKVEEFNEKYVVASELARLIVLPNLSMYKDTSDYFAIQQTMVEAGIEYMLGGKEAMGKVVDPVTSGPFVLVEMEGGGFELQSTSDLRMPLKDGSGDGPVSVTFGGE